LGLAGARPASWRQSGRMGLLGFLPVVLVLLLPVAPARAAGKAPPFSVQVDGTRLSVHAQDTPLLEILEAISRQSRAEIHLERTLEAQIAKEQLTVSFQALPLEEGLRRLLRHKNFILVYSSAGLTEVRVYMEGKGEFQRLRVEAKQPPQRPKGAQTADRPPGGAEDDPARLARLRGEALGHPDPAERSTALEKLAESDDEKLALDTALEVLDRERDPEVLESVLDLLSGQESVPLGPILKFVATDRGPAIRIRALELLGEHGKQDPRVSELLKTVARNDKNEEIRAIARSLLEDLEGE